MDHGFKVGPEYRPAQAAVAPQRIDAADTRVRNEAVDLSRWWSVFNDATLDDLVGQAYNQNISLKEYGARVLQARYGLAIARGELFPQMQGVSGGYSHQQLAPAAIPVALPPGIIPQSFDNWNLGFNLAWELDFWGLYRRQVLAAEAQFDASLESYDAVLVTLFGDVATDYVLMRQAQERIELDLQNVKLQRDILKIAQARMNAGKGSELDVDQQQTILSQTEATIPRYEITLRQMQDRLCVLLGIPSTDLQARLGRRPIPTAPREAPVGIPAQLLERRPDIRRAERIAAAQAQQIGIAEAQLYPHISISGMLLGPAALDGLMLSPTTQAGPATVGNAAENLSQLFTPGNFNASVGPTFQWNILEYGRIANNVRLQDAGFQQALLNYRATVLTANQEVENGLVAFLRSQEQAAILDQSVVAADKACKVVVAQYRLGKADYTRLAQVQLILQQQQDLEIRARGQIALGLIQVYRALGGGWEVRLGQGN